MPTLVDALKTIKPEDTLLGIIILSENRAFTLDELKFGIENASENFPDVNIPDMNEAISKINLSRTLDLRTHYDVYSLERNSAEKEKQRLLNSYERNILDDLKPVAKAVWFYAGHYRLNKGFYSAM